MSETTCKQVVSVEYTELDGIPFGRDEWPRRFVSTSSDVRAVSQQKLRGSVSADDQLWRRERKRLKTVVLCRQQSVDKIRDLQRKRGICSNCNGFRFCSPN